MSKWIAPALVSFFLIGTAQVSQAKTKSFIVDGSAMSGLNDVMTAFGVKLADFTDNPVNFAFTLPGNYKTNSPLKIILKGTSDDPGGDCDVYMIPFKVTRLRAGAAYSEATFAQSGLTEQIIRVQAGTKPVVNKAMTLRKAKAGAIRGQKAGDRIVVNLVRFSGDGRDTCTGDFTVLSAKIVYTVN